MAFINKNDSKDFNERHYNWWHTLKILIPQSLNVEDDWCLEFLYWLLVLKNSTRIISYGNDVRLVFFIITDVLNLCNYVFSKDFSQYNVINLISFCGELSKICK